LSWIRKYLIMIIVVERSACDTKIVSANVHSLKSVKSQSRKSLEALDVENCNVDMNLVATNGYGRLLKCRVSRVAMPNSLTSGALGLDLSCLDTSRLSDTKTTSEEGSKF
jgi:hypothetical protein